MIDKTEIFKTYPDIVTPEQVMKMLGIGKNTVYHLLNSGEIKSIRIGNRHKIPKIYVIDYIQGKTQ